MEHYKTIEKLDENCLLVGATYEKEYWNNPIKFIEEETCGT